MPTKLHHPAAFINAIADEGDMEEAIHFLQETWDELVNLKNGLFRLGFTTEHVNRMMKDGTLGPVF